MPSKKVEIEILQDVLDSFNRLVATNPEIDRKGVTVPYTSLNGNMFTFINKDGILGLRLAKKDREAFLEKYNTKLHESYVAIMKEYVAVPDYLLHNTEELKQYFDLSYEYAKTLKPKPAKKKKD